MSVEEIVFLNNDEAEIKVYLESVSAGFSNIPADGHIRDAVSLSEHFTRNYKETFLVRVSGDSMIRAGISNGDTLIVDYGIDAESGDIVVASYCGEIHVKVLLIEGDKISLCAANPLYKDIQIEDEARFRILGVVLHSVKTHYSRTRTQK